MVGLERLVGSQSLVVESEQVGTRLRLFRGAILLVGDVKLDVSLPIRNWVEQFAGLARALLDKKIVNLFVKALATFRGEAVVCTALLI